MVNKNEMQQVHQLVLFICLILSGYFSLVRGTTKSNETECNSHDAAAAMTMCQGERQKLSYASQANNTIQLCKALQHYSECMKPHLQGCQEHAKMAFEVITSKYTAEPYKCQLDIQPERAVNNASNKINGNNRHQQNSSVSESTTNDVDNSILADSNKDIQQLSQQLFSAKTSAQAPTDTVSSRYSSTVTVTTTKASTGSDAHNSALYAGLAINTVLMSIFFFMFIIRYIV